MIYQELDKGMTATIYQDIPPGSMLQSGDQIRWNGQWQDVHLPGFDCVSITTTKGIRYRRPMGQSVGVRREPSDTPAERLLELLLELKEVQDGIDRLHLLKVSGTSVGYLTVEKLRLVDKIRALDRELQLEIDTQNQPKAA